MRHQLINQDGKPVSVSDAAAAGSIEELIRDVASAERDRCSKFIIEASKQFVGDDEAQEIFVAAGHVAAGIPTSSRSWLGEYRSLPKSYESHDRECQEIFHARLF